MGKVFENGCTLEDVKSDEPNDYYGGVSTEYKEVIGNIFEGVDK
jgi:hypothetical protein